MGKRVLVADDSATIQKAFAMVFGGQDVALVAARSLEEALTSARQSKPDLVIADAALGARTGYELCAALKADPGLRATPVYILSSTHTPYDEARGREAGADGNLIKPFESQSIIDKVNEILTRAASGPVAVPAASAPVSSPPVASAARPASGPVPTMRRDPRDDEDDYGEVIIERPTVVAPAAASAAAALPAARAPSAPAPMGATLSGMPVPGGLPSVSSPAPTFPGLRPSLIPGARPGAGFAPRPLPATGSPSAPAAPNPFAARPAPAAPAQPALTPAVPSPAATGAPASLSASPAPTAPAGVGRTMMGMPAVIIPGVPNRAPSSPASPAPTPGMPGSTPRPAPGAPGATPFSSVVPTPVAAKPASAPVPVHAPANTQATDVTPPPASVPARVPPVAAAASPAASAAISARVEQKLGAVAARGPEYEAIARLSREIIEEIVWEVVPELAEIIIREHVERLAAAKK